MNFVITYEISNLGKVRFYRGETFIEGEFDKLLREEVFAAVYNLDERHPLTGVLFSHGGIMYEIRQGDKVGEYLAISHGGGKEWFLLFAGDGAGWWEDVNVLETIQGRARAAQWFPTFNKQGAPSS